MHGHEEWLLIAQQDLQSARVLYQAGLWTTSLYHVQQCAEKSLKGYLAYQNQKIKKTHDLVELVDECIKFDNAFSILVSHARTLKPYSTQGRYPDDYEEVDEHDVVEAIALVEFLFDFITKKLRPI